MGFLKKDKANPYRGVDDSPLLPSVSFDDMMAEMGCKVECNSLHGGRWEASIYWLARDELRASIIAHGGASSEAVSNLYQQFNRMKTEGWKRTD